MMAEFVDELPPRGDSPHQRSEKLQIFASELLANPGQWAKYPFSLREIYPAAVRINKGVPAWCSQGKFEAAVRKGVLYVRAVKWVKKR